MPLLHPDRLDVYSCTRALARSYHRAVALFVPPIYIAINLAHTELSPRRPAVPLCPCSPPHEHACMRARSWFAKNMTHDDNMTHIVYLYLCTAVHTVHDMRHHTRQGGFACSMMRRKRGIRVVRANFKHTRKIKPSKSTRQKHNPSMLDGV